jgi:hypothetical protein
MLVRGCSDLPLANFEDAFLEAVLRLLRHLTGVPWVRAFQEGARPTTGTTGVPDGQYGIVSLIGVTDHGSPMISQGDVINPATGELRDDKCELVTQMLRYSLQLDVYRDAGRGNRQQETAQVQQPPGSAIDVLIRLKMKLGHTRVREAFKQFAMQYRTKPIGPINNLPQELVKNTFENRATATLELLACPVSSLRVPTFGDQPFDFECPAFPDQPPPPPEC